MDKLDQQDIKQRNAALEIACAGLHEVLLSAGDSIPRGMIPSAPKLYGGDDLGYNRALLQYHGQLAGLLAGKHKVSVAAPAPVATAPAAQSVPVAKTSTVAPVSASAATVPTLSAANAPLTASELARATWPEKVELAGGKLTPAEFRARIADRTKAAASAQPKTLTEKLLKSKGVTSLAELPPHQNSLD